MTLARHPKRVLFLSVGLLLCMSLSGSSRAATHVQPGDSVRDKYTKQEVMIPMRDGVRLFTSIYMPKDQSQKYPIIMQRTPYSVGPYGADSYRGRVGPNRQLQEEGYICVYQDVRGCYMSEGEFVNMRPHNPNKTSPKDIDEASDTYDTIEWLIKNVPNNNGRVGMWGISYPGFYAAAGMIDAHPALKAVSPQAPIADWWYDDFRHHGALFLPHAFNFLANFDGARPKPTTSRSSRFSHGTQDGYQFFLEMGPLKNADAKYFKGTKPYWNELLEHCNYDEYWQARSILPHLKKTAPAVMTVGGWYDAEDLYGPLKIYRETEKNNPGIENMLVMGPWPHGGWAGVGTRLGHVRFGADTSAFYQEKIETPFFNHHLKGKGEMKLPEAYVFEVGTNRWRQFDAWPPRDAQKRSLHFHAKEGLTFEPAGDQDLAFDEYVSDPRKPVPFTEDIAIGMTRPYMTDDQRFASRRPDVLVYQTEPLKEDVTLVGPLLADLWVSTSGTDSDWVVKLVDVFPNDFRYEAEAGAAAPPGGGRRRITPLADRPMGGYQMMVRSEIIRGRFRNSYSKPQPFIPNEPAQVKLELQDVLHTFKKGHRIMIQVQSSWFPLVDRNPQKYVPNIAHADEADFIKATQRVYRSRKHPSQIRVMMLPTQQAMKP